MGCTLLRTVTALATWASTHREAIDQSRTALDRRETIPYHAPDVIGAGGAGLVSGVLTGSRRTRGTGSRRVAATAAPRQATQVTGLERRRRHGTQDCWSACARDPSRPIP